MNSWKQVWLLTSIFMIAGNVFVLSMESFDAAYMDGKQDEAYEETKKYIQELSSQLKDPRTNKIMQNGFMGVIDFVKSSTDTAYGGIKAARDSVNKTTSEAMIQTVNTAFAKSKEDIINSGATAYFTIGTLVEITNLTEGLKNATTTVTHNAEISFGGLDAARDLVNTGIKAGGDVLREGFLAGIKAVKAYDSTVLNVVKKAAKQTYDALSQGPVQESPEEELMKDETSQANPERRNAIRSVEESAEEHLNRATSDKKRYAIKVVRDFLIDGIKTVTTATTVFKAINETLTIQDKKAAIAALRESFEDCKNTVYVGISICQQTLGRLYEILGSEYKEAIIKAMLLTEAGRVDCQKGLANSLLIAIQGVENDDSENAIVAARFGIKTSGFSIYEQIVKSANDAMDTIVTSVTA